MKKLFNWFRNKKRFIITLIFFGSIASIIIFLHRIDDKTNNNNISYIQNFGWKIEKKPVEVKYVKVPNNFDTIYESYNDIQRKVGYDLTKYKGCKLMRYSYKVLNHEEETKNVRANVYILDEKIVSADICSTNTSGFIHEINDSSKIKK